VRVRIAILAAVLIAVLAAIVWRETSGAGLFSAKPAGVVPPTDDGGEERPTIVRADFNGDGRMDMAVSETDPLGRHRIAIYLRRDVEDSLRPYEKLGHIQNPGDFAAPAIMTIPGDGFTRLIVILAHADGRKEMVEYRSQGEEFVEVSRDPMGR
jgi:hypothetical protein